MAFVRQAKVTQRHAGVERFRATKREGSRKNGKQCEAKSRDLLYPMMTKGKVANSRHGPCHSLFIEWKSRLICRGYLSAAFVGRWAVLVYPFGVQIEKASALTILERRRQKRPSLTLRVDFKILFRSLQELAPW